MPSEAERNLEFVREGIQAFNRGDVEGVLARLDPEVEVFAGSEFFANAGTFRGHAGYLRWVEQWLDAWERFVIEIVDIEQIDETHVIVSAHQSATGRGSGIEVEQDVVYMWEVRDGKAVRMHLYPDRDAALAAVRAGQADGE